MTETGIISKTDRGYAVIEVEKHAECDRCGMCAFPKNAKKAEMRALNEVNAKVGDKVEFKTSEAAKYLGLILLFIVPLLFIGAAAFVGYVFVKKEIAVLVLSVFFLVLWYTIVTLVDKAVKKKDKYVSRVTAIISAAAETEENKGEVK